MGEQEKRSLLAFAAFLSQQETVETPAKAGIPEPQLIPRPDEESVVSAIKRLSVSYSMLDRSTLLTETSSLMTAHIMHGRSAMDVIDELETLFISYYEELKKTNRVKRSI
ncbi:Crp/Fnr family transcriptional regulator [Candidatus Vondammii sp. HM_W22]|uniref:Crp/Fnr family transcriptional regulator n=1 Tax=Candidatus Vondammii sp. HM_W22 TaxID=2687299 RepID=UPI002A4E1825|nr:Crp/Fnr family transcriptional regulator [Candidatus Vondammii sp. HM_W22]